MTAAFPTTSMRPVDLLLHAWTAVRSVPLRAFLITLAMGIGVASVILLIALGESARRYIVQEFEALGTHLLFVMPGRSETTGGQPPLFGETPRDLTLDDAGAILQSPYIQAVAPVTIGSAPVSARGLERESMIMGSTAALLKVRHLSMRLGKFLPETEADRALSVCVIGETIRTELFGTGPALGQWLRINDRRFRVIGILASEGQSISVDFDEIVIIPVASALALFNTESLFRVLAEAGSKPAMLAAVEDIRAIIRQRHEGEDDVTVITQDSVISTFDEILGALTLAVTAIAAISLAVAGILVMNVMLVTVAQRTAEIGLLKALGATSRQMRWIFLTEAAMLSTGGALFGILVGHLGLYALQAAYPEFPLAIPNWALYAAVAVALVTGLLSGVMPASRAARLDPIQALSRR